MGQGNDNTKTRTWQQLTEKERYKIEGWVQSGKSEGEIAGFLGKHRRTIRREIAKGMVVQRDSHWVDRGVYSNLILRCPKTRPKCAASSAFSGEV